MFSNRFNTRNDPLLEAAQAAMKDGETRRQAEAFVNEQFGVYSRKAVVREELAAYDAALEEAYGALKEGVQLDELLGRGHLDAAVKSHLEKKGYTHTKSKDPEGGTRHSFEKAAKTPFKGEKKGFSYTRYKEKGEKHGDVNFGYYSKSAKSKKPNYGESGNDPESSLPSLVKSMKEGVQIDEMAHKALTAAGYKAGPKDSTTGFGRTYTKGKKSVYVDADGFARHGSGSKATVTHGNKETAAYLNRGKKMEEGNDGNLANNYPPYDKVTRGDVIAGATGKDQMGGKKKAVKEGTAEAETSMSVTKDNKPSTPAQTNASTSGPSASDKAALASKIKTMREEQIDELYGKGKLKDIIAARQEKEHKAKLAYKRAENKMMDARSETGKAEKVKEKLRLRNISKPGDPHYNWAHSKKKLREEEQIDEAAYSAKAARAGKDIGKPGKQFSKIAKSAAKRYGSEERGKKVAGAILARIRAKHMKEENLEELSAFGSAFAAARKSGQTQFSYGGKSFNTKMASSTSKAAAPIRSPEQKQAAKDASTIRATKSAITNPTTTGSTGAKFAGTDAISAPAGSAADRYGNRTMGAQSSVPASGTKNVGVGTGTSVARDTVKTNVSAMKAGQAQTASDAKNMRIGNSGQTNATVTNTDSKGNTTSAAKPEGGMWNSIKQAVYDKTGIGSDNRGAAERGMGSVSSASTGTGGKSSGTGTGSSEIKDRTGVDVSKIPSATGGTSGLPKTPLNKNVYESVQIGDNKYRII